ncbi:hypothetical protein [Flavobacterium sp. ASW18X]|uniref:hypothetical protein n=1 Tax=Flavobacterium sp. ASW18X TaxID=2572595 RepID=UPI0010ADD947|nr:hypothetical protein [Flavobacterium sp. ASW18X]TKD66718.1 hypothetical protein FBT53_02360 [Flavobacterium sp. ASW18X]
MTSVKESPYYKDAIQEINYPFGDYYLFENFVVAEVKEDIVFNWKDHAKQVVEELTNLYDHNGKEVVYISNRVNNYSVVPSDWIHFFRFSYSLKGYAIVTQKKGKSWSNSLLEKMFMRNQMQTFLDLEDAIEWANELGNKPKKYRSVI